MFASIVLAGAGALASLGGTPRVALVATDVADSRPQFRFPASQAPSTASNRSRTLEWMDAGNWRMTAGYASTKRTQITDRLDAAFDNKSGDVRSAKGLRLAAELLSSGGVNSGEALALDARVQHVRIQDSSLTHGGEKLGDARLTIVFRHSW